MITDSPILLRKKVKSTNYRDFDLANWDCIALNSNLEIGETSLLGKVRSVHRDEMERTSALWTTLLSAFGNWVRLIPPRLDPQFFLFLYYLFSI